MYQFNRYSEQGRALFTRVLQADTEVQKKPLKKKAFPIIFDEPEFPGLSLGVYEEKRKELVKERNLDYNKFLEEKQRILFSRIFYPVKDPQSGVLRWKVLPIFSDESEFLGLPLGVYEEKRKEQLIKERNLDYNKFLEEKEKQEELKRYARKLQSEFGIILPDPADFTTTSYSMLTSNIFGFAPPSYGQHNNGLLPYDPKQIKEEYRQALQQQIDDQKKRKEMEKLQDMQREKLQDMQSSQKQSLYQPSFIDGSAHRRPYLMQQNGGISQTSISPSMSVDSLEQVSLATSVPSHINTFPIMPSFPQTVIAPSLNNNSGLLFESESNKGKDKEFYREDLRRQIEEKKRREEEEKIRLRMEEECLALRVEQQRLRMLQEYENERQKKLQKEEELRWKQERLWQLQEQQRKEAEDSRHLLYKRKLEEAEKERTTQKVDNSDLTILAAPIPAESSSTKSEIPSPPADPRTQVLSQLSLIRQQLHEEKKQKKEMLQQKKTYQVMDRADDDDLSTSNPYNPEQDDANYDG